MASEITLSASLSVVKNSTALVTGSFSKVLDLAGDETIQGSLSANTSTYTDLPLSSLETVGMILIKNNDPTNYVKVAHFNNSTEQEIGKLRPGAFMLFEPKWAASYAIRVKADTGACEVFFAATEA